MAAKFDRHGPLLGNQQGAEAFVVSPRVVCLRGP